MAFYILIILLATASPSDAATYTPSGGVVGEVSYYTVRQEDNLYEIARKNDIGIVELLAANPGIDPWTPPKGTKITLTTAHLLPPVREGIVLNLSELRLFYFMKKGNVMTFPIGIGQEGWQTPLGTTLVASKRRNPPWIPPSSIREENPDLPDIVSPGPDNPLGAYALYLGWKKFLIHGTNRPYGIGKRSSHGCVRLYPEDIEILFNAVSVGTKVTIIDTPYKLGWRANKLYLEVTPTQQQSDAIAQYRRPLPISIPEIYKAIQKIAGEKSIDWYRVEEAISTKSGVPAIISK
jgi:L,D-transpeptidase ErfK/SrfK